MNVNWNPASSIINNVKQDPVLAAVAIGSFVPMLLIGTMLLAGPGVAGELARNTVLGVLRTQEFGGVAWLLYAGMIHAGLVATAAFWLGIWPAGRKAVAGLLLTFSAMGAISIVLTLGSPKTPTDVEALAGAAVAIAVLVGGGWLGAKRIWAGSDWRAFAVSAFNFRIG